MPKVYVTKFTLTRGTIDHMPAKLGEHGGVFIKYPNHFSDYIGKSSAHNSMFDAETAVAKKIARKTASLKKQLQDLEELQAKLERGDIPIRITGVKP